MGDASWWYEWEGRQAGPVDEAALLELARSGRLRPEARVWRSGMAGWEPLRAVRFATAAGAEALPYGGTATPTPAATPTWTATTPSPQPSPPPGERGMAGTAALPEGMEPTSTAAVLVLGVLTLGIYPAVRFYQAGVAYQQLVGRASRFTSWFWLSIALGLLGAPLHLLGGVPGVLCHIAAIAFTVLTLFEFLALRAELVTRHGIAPALTPDGTHKALFIAGLLTTWFLVGFALLAVQAVKLFQDHRALGDALRARRATATAPG
jgi:GYF domain 2